MQPVQLVRSLLFYLCFYFWLIIVSSGGILLSWLFKPSLDKRLAGTYMTQKMLVLLLPIAGVRVKLHEEDPSWRKSGKPCVVVANHQSAFETFYLQPLFRPMVTVLKRELLQLPFFGPALALLEPLVLERNKKMESARKVIEQGIDRLSRGISVLIFPQGTRGQSTLRFSRSAAQLALQADVPLVPIAHNAGSHWQNKKLLIRPGTIEVYIGKPVATEGHTAAELTSVCQSWVEHQLQNTN